jgi:carbon monoxide dehydrogenase subunit G
VNLEYSGREDIPAGLDLVWAFITDPTSVASCVPEMVDANVLGPRSADATVQFSVGPVRGSLTLRLTLEPDAAARHLRIRIAGGSFGGRVDVNAAATATAVGANATALDWNATVAVSGPVAALGGRGIIDAQAKRVITRTFENVKARLTPIPDSAG